MFDAIHNAITNGYSPLRFLLLVLEVLGGEMRVDSERTFEVLRPLRKRGGGLLNQLDSREWGSHRSDLFKGEV